MTSTKLETIPLSLLVPGLPHPLLCPEKNPGWAELRAAFDRASKEILESGVDCLVVYSTMWPSILGHQIQADPSPEWVHVDELFHDLGSIPYKLRMDSELAAAVVAAAESRGLHARTVSYHGFPIDTGSVVALKLLTPKNEIPAIIVSSNVYCDRAETIVLGKAVRQALEEQGKRAAVVVVSTLSNRLFTDFIDPKDDHIHSPKDDEWNRKILEFLAAGRLEDVAQLSREIHKQIRIQKVVSFKAMWFLSAMVGQHNNFDGEVLAYAPIVGTGSAVVSLRPSSRGIGEKEFDEDNVEVFTGERSVLAKAKSASAALATRNEQQPEHSTEDEAVRARFPEEAAPSRKASKNGKAAPAGSGTIHRTVHTSKAPSPVGAYPHARRVGEWLYISGMGPRQPGTGAIPGGPIVDEAGQPRDYDIKAQTRAVIENIRAVCAEVGLGLENVVDVQAFLVDMKRDFKGYNEVYAEAFGGIQATRTTVEVRALPTPIAVEFKCIARFPEGQ
jgi:2-aminophenol/2-amino-5-chlorophenol 1,6-dioxygenase alpha subunit